MSSSARGVPLLRRNRARRPSPTRTSALLGMCTWVIDVLLFALYLMGATVISLGAGVTCRRNCRIAASSSNSRLTRQRPLPIPGQAGLLHPGCMTAPLRTDLNDFLFASVASDASGPLTMHTVLARRGVDP